MTIDEQVMMGLMYDPEFVDLYTFIMDCTRAMRYDMDKRVEEAINASNGL